MSDAAYKDLTKAAAIGGATTSSRWRAIIPSATAPRIVIGVDPGSSYAAALVTLHQSPAGVWQGVGQGQVALSDVAAARLHAHPGSVVELQTPTGPKEFTVAGTFATEVLDDASVGDWVIVEQSRARDLWGAVRSQVAVDYNASGPGGSRSEDVAVLAAAEPRVARSMSGLSTAASADGLHVYDLHGWESAVGATWAHYFRPFSVTGYVVLFAAGMSVLNMFLLGLVQRRRERAVLRAVGMTDATERRVILLQAGLLAVLAAAFGTACSLYFTTLLSQTSRIYYGFQLDWGFASRSTLIGIAGVAVMALIGALWPLVHAGRLEVASTLQEE